MQIRPVAGLRHVLVHRGEQPQRVVCPIAGVPRLLNVAVILRRIFMAGIMGVLHQRQTRAVGYLRGQHESQPFLRRLRIQMDHALNILHRIAIAVAVALSAVDQGRSPAPHKGGEALEGVPCVDHVVEILVRRFHLQIFQLAVPQKDQHVPLRSHYFRRMFLIALHQSPGFGFALLGQNKGHRAALAGLQLQRRVQRAAGISAVVQTVVATAVYHSLRAGEPVLPQKPLPAARVAGHLRACQTEEPFQPIFAVGLNIAEFVDVLQQMVALELSTGNVLRVLHVHQILLVVAVSGQFAVAEQRQLPGPIGKVGQLHPPDLVRSVQRHIVQRLAFDVLIPAFDLGIGRAVTADGLVAFQRLLHRPPAGRPVFAGLVIPQIHIAARLVELVEGIAQDPARCAGLDKAVAARILRHNCAIGGGTQIVGPRHGRAGIRNHVFPFFPIKIAVLHQNASHELKRFRNDTFIISVGKSQSFFPQQKELPHLGQLLFAKKSKGMRHYEPVVFLLPRSHNAPSRFPSQSLVSTATMRP